MFDNQFISEIFSRVIPILGHASFLLTFLSYSQKNIIRLRAVAVASLFLGLIYNSWIDVNMPEGQDIHLVVLWLAIFMVQNIYLLVREIRESMEVHLPLEQRELLVASFPAMHSQDWKKLMACAQVKNYQKGDEVLALGASTQSIQLIADGTAEENRCGSHKPCRKGTIWGELTYVMGEDYYNSSPVSIVATSDTLTVLEWKYEKLRKLSSHNSRFDAALQNGFVHSAGMKHGLLVPVHAAPSSAPALQAGSMLRPVEG